MVILLLLNKNQFWIKKRPHGRLCMEGSLEKINAPKSFKIGKHLEWVWWPWMNSVIMLRRKKMNNLIFLFWNPNVGISWFWTVTAVVLTFIYFIGMLLPYNQGLWDRINEISKEKWTVLESTLILSLFIWSICKIPILGILFLVAIFVAYFLLIKRAIECEMTESTK